MCIRDRIKVRNLIQFTFFIYFKQLLINIYQASQKSITHFIFQKFQQVKFSLNYKIPKKIIKVRMTKQIALNRSACVKFETIAILIVKYPKLNVICLLYTSPSPRDRQKSRMPSSA
eukprot:TRINITY_DN40041_c0_g1_i1.p1 TRINITY_DN40041_c0_g1~~TRINITY_DN40041_c0_g1_i1.p1  ORF type:complete len:116 (+),score=13.34 TRINITY_DN40041_c0_g1_i1:92-439(+)